ncbi:MAG: LPS-assembly protein LptD, partial [Salinivirgaceae bacterium]|nr:LPS-assembly protein LptD [Salinivirgaceae bacterium]
MTSAADTLATAADSLSVADSSATKKPKAKKNLLTTDVKTSAKDSTIFSLDGKKVFLFGDAKIEYEDIVLTAAYIEADMDQGIIYAEGVADSTGNIEGRPVFKQGDEEMKAINITYNVNTKRGYIEKLYTEQEDGYLHSELTKKEVDNSINMLHGKYTTCELEDPHFYLELTKGKYIPDKAIIAGPSYMVMADIPLPLVIPFGYFPITKKKTSGFLMPRVGEENNRGFFLSDGGYYFAGNDYVDFTLRGSIYSKGSWSLNGSSRYTLRYKFSGDVNVTYAKNVFGDKGLKGYSEPQEYRIGWSHWQDPKARPNSTFSASVDFSSKGYNKYQTRSSQDYLTNTTSSSISYRMDRIMNSPFSLSIDIRHVQNTRDSSLTLTLPNFTLNMSRVQPFKRRKAVGPMRWYEDIGISYNGVFKNEV